MLTRSIIYTWMFSLLVSTVGVSMHAVYCYCVGTTTLQLMPLAENSESEQEKDCCKNPVQPVRSKKSCCQETGTDEGCMKTTTKVFVLKTDLELSKVSLKISFLPDFEDQSSFYDLPVFSGNAILSSVSNKAPPGDPPVLSGRDICLRGSIFRC